MDSYMLEAGSTPTCEDYLAITSLTNDIFLIGVLDSGVTIFNQQVRALNLIWALDRVKRLDSASSIAIVGGGIAGLTAAMALRTICSLTTHSLRPSITLFEQRSVLCPLQRGCATRWVHPHIYDWPEEGSTNPSAGLPIMNWRAGRASDVATTIVSEWEDPSDIQVKAVVAEEWRNLRYLKIDHKTREIEWIGEQHAPAIAATEGLCHQRQFDIIILAIGFGDEAASFKYSAVSYWRNETLGQPDLSGQQQRYLVSGTGDGGLIDLLRLRIADFREDRIGYQLVKEGSDAHNAIRQLRSAWYKDPDSQGADLFHHARELGRKYKLIDAINRRLRADTVVSLQIRSGHRVSDAFRGKSSFVNRLLVSLLFDAGGFSPRFGNLESFSADGFDKVIVRHGTNKRAHLESVFSEDISALLKHLDEKRSNQKSIVDVFQRERLWKTGWPLDRKTGSGPGSAKRDYVPDATVAVSSAFVSALAPVFSARGGRYRATLHRIITTHKGVELHLQQIAHYHGPRAAISSADKVIGRLFTINDAVIGLAARTGRVLTTICPEGQSDDECRRLLREDMQLLNGDIWDPKRMADDVSSLFACPLMCSKGDVAESHRVVAVLFADSTQAGAFDSKTVSQIVAACEEFGRYLESILERQVQSQTTEVISVQSEATFCSADDSSEDFRKFKVLTALPARAPRVSMGYINLEWWT